MGKQPASPESVAVLIENSKRGIYDSEKLLEKIEDTKTIFESISTIEGTALEFLQIVFFLIFLQRIQLNTKLEYKRI